MIGQRSLDRKVALLLVASMAGASACRTTTTQVATQTADSMAIRGFKNFDLVTAPPPPASSVTAAATNDSNRAGVARMNMDPMLATSLVGRAMQQDITEAFTDRGYGYVANGGDFYVAYYAGTGQVVDTRAAAQRYHGNGRQINTQTYEYPAGTVVIDVVNARNDSLVWRGTAISEIPNDPDNYAAAIKKTFHAIVSAFPKARR